MKRRALTMVLSLAGIALLTAVGVQIYRSQRYASFVYGLQVADAADGCLWEFEAGHLRPKEGKFRGWYLSVDLNLHDALIPDPNPHVVLTERPSEWSRWSLRNEQDRTELIHRGPSYDEWSLSLLPIRIGKQHASVLILQPPESAQWPGRLAKSDRGVRIRFEEAGETLFLKPPTDAEVETFDHWAEPDPLPSVEPPTAELQIVD
ncbi:MAG: hypothetical protein AAF488_15565 [Planctomycetota bacterium]